MGPSNLRRVDPDIAAICNPESSPPAFGQMRMRYRRGTERVDAYAGEARLFLKVPCAMVSGAADACETLFCPVLEVPGAGRHSTLSSTGTAYIPRLSSKWG